MAITVVPNLTDVYILLKHEIQRIGSANYLGSFSGASYDYLYIIGQVGGPGSVVKNKSFETNDGWGQALPADSIITVWFTK